LPRVIDGDHLNAAKVFGQLATEYLERADVITAFALLLWRAVAYRKANALKGAKAAARDACALQRREPVRVSPSWWAREIVDAARIDDGERCADDLLETAVEILDAPRQTVEIRGEEIRVNGSPMPADAWQRRSGTRVLRRLFASLVDAHPRIVPRYVLADSLWPDSEGDKAVRNLYAATKDLRRVLSNARGLRLGSRRWLRPGGGRERSDLWADRRTRLGRDDPGQSEVRLRRSIKHARRIPGFRDEPELCGPVHRRRKHEEPLRQPREEPCGLRAGDPASVRTARIEDGDEDR